LNAAISVLKEGLLSQAKHTKPALLIYLLSLPCLLLEVKSITNYDNNFEFIRIFVVLIYCCSCDCGICCYCYTIEEESKVEDDYILLIFSNISTIAVLMPQIPVLNENDPSGWSFTHS
jgi:hypothetical protein